MLPMLPILVVALQTPGPIAGGPAAPDPTRLVRPCPVETGSDVVVCGRPDQDRYRLRPLPERFVAREALPRAETRIGNAKVGVVAQDAGVGGFTSHRVMAGIKLPF